MEEVFKLKKEPINWKNIILALIWTFVVYLFSVIASASFFPALVFIIPAIIATVFAKKFRTWKYHNCKGTLETFVLTLAFGPLSFWVFSYHFLQIINGLRLTRLDYAEQVRRNINASPLEGKSPEFEPRHFIKKN